SPRHQAVTSSLCKRDASRAARGLEGFQRHAHGGVGLFHRLTSEISRAVDGNPRPTRLDLWLSEARALQHSWVTHRREERRVAMATYKELAKATTPLGFFEPRLFGPRWLTEFDRFFNREFPVTTGAEAFEAGWAPEMEVFEKNNVFTVRLDAPG